MLAAALSTGGRGVADVCILTLEQPLVVIRTFGQLRHLSTRVST